MLVAFLFGRILSVFFRARVEQQLRRLCRLGTRPHLHSRLALEVPPRINQKCWLVLRERRSKLVGLCF